MSNDRTNREKILRVARAAGCFAAVCCVAPAWAQDSAGPAATNAIEEIIVTARRTEENLQKVPIAITALTDAVLREKNIVDLRDLNRVVPGLGVTATGTERQSTQLIIRGQGAAPFGAEPAVITYFAEVPTLAPGAGNVFDLQNIQVLKGPQGTLFGRNTTGGALLLEPRRPMNELGASFEATVGSYELRRVQAAVNIPVIDDKLLVRVAVDGNYRKGFTRDIKTGQDYDDRNYTSIRFSLTLRPTDRLENRLILGYTDTDTNGAGTVITNINPTGIAARSFPTLPAVFAAQLARGPRRVDYLNPPFFKAKQVQVTNTTTYEATDELTVKNIFGYRDYRARVAADVVGALPVIQILPGREYTATFGYPSTTSYTDELQLQGKTGDGRLTWILGGFYGRSDPVNSRTQDLFLQFGRSVFVNASGKYDRTRAVFGQASYKLMDDLTFTVGGRYTWDSRRIVVSQYLNTPAACSFTGAVQAVNCVVKLARKFHAPTGNASLDYQIAPRTLVYATVRRGYKSGGFNASAANPSSKSFEPEYVTDVELGLKTDFNLGTVKGRFNADIFRGSYEDLQESASVAETLATGAVQTLSRIVNAGKAIVQGVELEGTLIPIDNVQFNGFYAYTDAYYKENFFTTTTNGVVTTVDVKNAPFQNTPKHKFGVSGQFTLPLGGSGTLVASADYTYQTRVVFLEPLTPILRNDRRGQDGYGLVNLRLDWQKAFGSRVDLNFFMTNVTNKTYKSYENDAYESTGVAQTLFGEPRMYGGGLRVTF